MYRLHILERQSGSDEMSKQVRIVSGAVCAVLIVRAIFAFVSRPDAVGRAHERALKVECASLYEQIRDSESGGGTKFNDSRFTFNGRAQEARSINLPGLPRKPNATIGAQYV